MATTEAIPVIKVLFTLHPGMDAMDFIGPLEVLSHAKHNLSDDCKLNSRATIDPPSSSDVLLVGMIPRHLLAVQLSCSLTFVVFTSH